MRRPRLFTAIEAAAVSAFTVIMTSLLYRLSASLEDGWDAIGCALAAAAGWLAADFVSGLVHWFADTFFEEDTPGIGPLLIQPFREHHRDPQAMTRHGFLELTGNSCLILLPVVGAALVLSLSPHSQAAVAAFALGLFATNLFHKWAHDSAAPSFVQWLQSRWLILPPAHHLRHHSANHGAAYCVTTGWTNALAEACGAFAALRRLLTWLRVPAARLAPGAGPPLVLADSPPKT
jgi:ubiquitin-conjugating enzyme E2 variant